MPSLYKVLGLGVPLFLPAIVACRDLPQQPLLLSASIASAAPLILDQHVPFDFAAENPCTGEPFTGSGYTHVKLSISTFPNVHISEEENLENVKGTTATGIRYVVPSQSSSHTIIDSDFAPANGTTEEMQQFIRQREDGALLTDDDFYMRIRVHSTVNANGDATASFSDLTMECK